MLDKKLKWLCFAICLCAATLQTAAYFPGYLSHDSAYQWWQARTGQFSTVWPPGALWLLRVLDHLGSGPAAVFVLNIFGYWVAVALIATRMASWRGALITLVLLGTLPISLICMPHVWIDVLMTVLLMAVTALFLIFATAKNVKAPWQMRWLTLSIVLLFFTGIVRHNAMFAIAPMCVFAAHLVLRKRAARRWTTLLCGGMLFAATIGFYIFAVKIGTDKRAETWSVTLMWDLQALSIKTGRVLIPESMHAPGLTVDELKNAFRPVDGAFLYAAIKTPIANPLEPYSSQQREDLIRAWRDAILAHPQDYLAHRLYVAKKTLGPKHVHEEDGTADQPGFVALLDNPPVVIANPRLNAYAQPLATWLKSSTLLAPAWWLLSGTLIVGVLAWRRRRDMVLTDGLSITLVVSAWMYLAPLTVLAPAADLRYALWPVIACVIATVTSLFAPRVVAPITTPMGAR
jgi:hypothetical protein